MSNKPGGKNGTEFFIGIVLLAVGLFMLSKRVIVSSGWYVWSLWGFDVSSGLVVIPLIAGIIWMFYNPKSILAKILTILGGLFIVATIIMSIRIHFMPTSLYDYIIILVMMAAGAGMLLKSMSDRKKE